MISIWADASSKHTLPRWLRIFNQVCRPLNCYGERAGFVSRQILRVTGA
jgi:hypothetical protein